MNYHSAEKELVQGLIIKSPELKYCFEILFLK